MLLAENKKKRITAASGECAVTKETDMTEGNIVFCCFLLRFRF